MKFVDEAWITVQAGKGGDGCLGFHREKYVRKGGPNGGDGGEGGNVYLEADANLNTLVDFRNQRFYEAESGEKGMGKECTGRSGNDLIIRVPLGTSVSVESTKEFLGDLTEVGQRLLVAKGGRRGLGNTHFKSSTNQAPRKTTKGAAGEKRELLLELTILADVGLLGMPNAGKSTLIRAVSAATPRVADYPFTTLHPYLGVVRIAADQSFVMADIPGLIEGAAQGAGLGVQFLKHLMRTKILLHIVDIAPNDGSDPAIAAVNIIKELKAFDESLITKPRWLVFNKIDLLDPDELEQRVKKVINALAWQGDVIKISALKKLGTQALCYQLMGYLQEDL